MKRIFQFFVWFFKELLLTFSSQPSFFSKKRIETFIIFINGLILLDAYFFCNIDKITPEEALLYFASNMGYAGWQTLQIIKEKLYFNNNKNSVQPNNSNLEDPTQQQEQQQQ